MTLPALPDGVRRQLIALLSQEPPANEPLLSQLRDLHQAANPVYAAALRILTRLEVDDRLAEELLRRVLEHRSVLERALGRDPGLAVAALDYLTNVDRRLHNPTIVELERLQETERSAISDPLTGLYNRRYFEEALARELRRSRRYELPLAVVIFDLDGFKRVNDAYGHPFGDQILARVGEELRGSVRESDVTARFGGEEFALILPEAGRLGAYAVAERIRRRVERAFGERPPAGRELGLTISGGIGCYPADARDARELVRRADESLYRAKRAGKNHVAPYHAERRAAVRFPARPTTRLALAHDGQRAAAQALDLSRRGALVETRGTFEPAQPVRVFLEPTDAAPGWSGDGRVVRVEGRSREPWGYRVGLSFDEPLPEWCLRAHTLPGAGGPSVRRMR